MSGTAVVADFVTKSRWEDCPATAVAAARRAIIDCLGVMLAGSLGAAGPNPPVGGARVRAALRCARSSGPARRTGAVWASLCNGTAAHALDFDDTNFVLLGHPSAPVLAAALAAGELALADGQALVHAFLLGFEVETTLAAVINPEHYEHGWHATCTLGTLGAAAAAARLLGLDAAQIRTALAVAASQSSGLKENFGTMTKPFHAGHAARSGVLSALLAREGWTASEHALEGPQGFFNVLGAGARRIEALDTLGAPWKILTSGVAVKPYPSCACTHSIIDGALELGRVHRIRPDDVAEVTVDVNAIVPRILIHSDPRTGLEAKFSAEFSAAAALCDGRVGIATFQDDKTRGPGDPVADDAGEDAGGSRDPGRCRASHVDARHGPAHGRPTPGASDRARCRGIRAIHCDRMRCETNSKSARLALRAGRGIDRRCWTRSDVSRPAQLHRHPRLRAAWKACSGPAGA